MQGNGKAEQLEHAMESTLSEGRYRHTLGVSYTAAALAMRYGAVMEDARIAGLLHDCAKELTEEEQLAACVENKIPVSEVERQHPYLLHAKLGAWVAEKKYGIMDRDILNAIAHHITGRENMSLLEKVIFVADYIEPGRVQAPNLPEIRQLAFADIDRALIRVLEDTLSYVKAGGGAFDSATEVTLQFYRAQAESAGRNGSE